MTFAPSLPEDGIDVLHTSRLREALLLVGRGGSAVDLASLAGRFAARNFSRDQEPEADRFGLALLAAECGHASAAAVAEMG